MFTFVSYDFSNPFITLLFFMTLISLNAQHKAPDSIQQEVKKALSFYPQLADTHITFKFKKNIKKSTMQAQPDFGSLFSSKKKRKYKILISRKFKISGKEFKTKDIPSDILVGWLGHELGHITDYQDRSSLNLCAFGARYLFSDRHIRSAERTADSIAVARGMENYILKTKNFILDHAEIAEKYKSRIQKYYLSPEEIMLLVEEREAK